MNKVFTRVITIIVLGTLPTGAIAQEQKGPPSADAWTISAAAYFTGDASVDAGGDWSVTGLQAKAGYSWRLDSKSRAGVEFSFARQDHSFGTTFDPWGTVYQTNLGFSWNRSLNNDWSLMLAPSVGLSMEDGADTSDSVEFGTILAFNKVISQSLQLGIGTGIYSGLEDTRVFPFIFIRWQINDQWYLGNPFAPGPVGPAGLELGYRVNDKWSLAGGGAYRSERFRLNGDASFGDGFGESKGVTVFLRSSYSLDRGKKIHLYLGTILAGDLTIEDATGQKILSTDFDPAFLAAISYQGRF